MSSRPQPSASNGLPNIEVATNCESLPSRRLAYAPNMGEPLLLQLMVRQTRGSEIGAYRQAFGKQLVDTWVGIAQTAEQQVSECMVAGHPGSRQMAPSTSW